MARVSPGDKVRDRLTGLEGVVVGRFEWLYGCVRIQIQPGECKDGKPAEPATYDEGQVDVVQAQAHPYEPPSYNAAPVAARPGTGGPSRDVGQRADPTR